MQQKIALIIVEVKIVRKGFVKIINNKIRNDTLKNEENKSHKRQKVGDICKK